MELLSPRLRLRLLAADELQALLEGRPADGLAWADGYPLEGSLVAGAMHAQLLAVGAAGPFGLFQVIRRHDGVVVGDIGFHGPPDALGEIGLAFDVVPAQRRRGYATEALRTLLGWALARPEVRAVQADAERGDVAACRVLAQAGMALVADEDERQLYEIAA